MSRFQANPHDHQLEPFVDATSWRDDKAALAEFARTRGYLFFRRLIPEEPLLALRRLVQLHGERCGLLAAVSGQDPSDAAHLPAKAGNSACFTGHYWDDPRWIELHTVLFQSSEFWAIAEDPGVLDVLTAVFGAPPQTRCGDVCRLLLPRDPTRTTPMHQDLRYVAGPAHLWTVWLPLVDCPLELGPLAVLPASHQAGLWPHSDTTGCEPELTGKSATWASSPFELGDVLMFHGLTVHGPWHNLTQERVRLSVDYRYLEAPSP